MIIGYEKIVDFFEQAIKKGQLGQAYVLAGKKGLGKNMLAHYLAAQILKVDEQKLSSHPDFVAVSRLADEKTGKLKTEITVKQARELKERLGRSGWVSEHQVCVITEADKLSTEASNALLKLLEEPTSKMIIFLLMDNDADILPTIKSRVQTFNLFPLNDKALHEGLVKAKFKPSEISEVLEYAEGQAGTAIYLLRNPEEFAKLRAEKKRWQNLSGVPFYQQVKLLSDIFEKKDESERVSEILQEKFSWWIRWSRKAMLNFYIHKAEQQVIKRPEELAVNIDNLIQAQDLLNQQVNPRLVTEAVVKNF